MTPRMIRCLSDAEALPHRGLERQDASWSGIAEAYPSRMVRTLVELGYLALYARGSVAHITDAGQQALEAWRERRWEARP